MVDMTGIEPPRDAAGAGPTARLRDRVGRDLGPRVVSGLALAGFVVALAMTGLLAFDLLILGVGAIIAWEWGRMVRGAAVDGVLVAHITAVLVAGVLAALGMVVLALAAVVIGAILVAMLAAGRHPGFSALGVVAAGLPTIALIWLRADEPWGLMAVLFIMSLVVVTDTAAYFSGRLIGGPKLWPRVSPNKTWAGLIGAVVASALVAALVGYFTAGAKVLHLAAFGGVLAVVAQAGDLAESALKRHFKTKDASNIIPGHGGFMDRVDGLATASVFAAIFAAVTRIDAPAQALLLW
jgi:phosphatidate cytidylyltransferase